MSTSDFSIAFLNRSLSAPEPMPRGEYVVLNFSDMAVGGSDRAEIEVTGDYASLLSLVYKLRCGVEIRDRSGTIQWIGYISSVQACNREVSLDQIANRVRVTYVKSDPGVVQVNENVTTAWAEDAASIADYGYKERTEQISQATSTNANALRTTVLAQLAQPTVIPSFGMQRMKARIICRGWFSTLDWKFYSKTADTESYKPTAVAWQNLKYDTAANLAWLAGQPFQVSTALYCHSIKIILNHTNDTGWGGGNVNVNLYSNSGSNPGSQLTTCQVGIPNFSGWGSWYEFVQSADTLLTASTTYWIVVYANSFDYSTLQVQTATTAGYTYGGLKVRDTNNTRGWYTPSPSNSMSFDISFSRSRNSQIDALLTSQAQFITVANFDGVTLPLTASNAYRDGNMTGLQIVEEILREGTSSGRRLLANVLPNLTLNIYEEPARNRATALQVDANGDLYTAQGAPLLYSPVGKWCRYRDDVPVPENILFDPTMFFIERATFNTVIGRWENFEPRDVNSAWATGVKCG